MSFINNQSRALMEFQKKLFSSRFFAISVLLHFIIVLAFGGTVLFNAYVEPPDFSGDPGGSFVASDSEAAPPAPDTPDQTAPSFTVQAPTMPNNSIETITTNSLSAPTFTMPQITAPTISPNADITKQMTTSATGPTSPSTGALTALQAKQIGAFTGGWAKKGSGNGPGSNPRTREFEFTAYLAKYGNPSDPTRGGDWASTNLISNGKIVKGSLPNLLYLMNKMSRDKIKALPQAVPLDLSSQEIFAKKPPFIFFTGHRDFVLTAQEVENLQNYIRLGGCIWGDSSLPGRNSRFDIAFRREMRRVIPDADKDWEQLPPNHAIFTKNLYYPEIKSPPPGINYYEEPVYALKFAGEIAVLYTANDYGDMWQIALDDKAQYDMSQNEHHQFLFMNKTMLDMSRVYYRNINLKTVFDSYKFGTNVVIHLITRWEDKLRTAPTGL